MKARAAAEERQRRPIIAQIAPPAAPSRAQYTTLNAFAATVSPDQQTQLQQDPSVAAVVPDQSSPAPDQQADQSPPNALSPVTAAPGQPVDAADDDLPDRPEQAAARGRVPADDARRLQRSDDPAGGEPGHRQGRRVAFFADGLDVNNPDFIRPDGSHVFIDYQDFTGDGPNAPHRRRGGVR